MKRGRKFSIPEIRNKLMSYCARQERCHQEVKSKLKDLGLFGIEAEEIIAYLIENNFLNEGRFAKLYARSKFNQKSWGWNKIRQGLQQKNIYETCIAEAKQEIDQLDYEKRLENLLLSKFESLEGKALEKKAKVFRYLTQKGYEYDLIHKVYNKRYG